MRRPLIVGNWKMNGTLESVGKLVSDLKVESLPSAVDVAVCPPFVHLPLVREMIAGSTIRLGAQHVSEQTVGAFTGEVSAAMLAELGCEFVIIGHSERRALYGETDALVVARVRQVLACGMTPIVCVGETLTEREADETEAVIACQMKAVLDGLSEAELAGLVVAYEPVWAIGTGKTASPEQAQAVHAFIRGLWAAHGQGGKSAPGLRVLYGGSVKADNARLILAQPDVDGGLVGGAALDAAQFLAIISAAV